MELNMKTYKLLCLILVSSFVYGKEDITRELSSELLPGCEQAKNVSADECARHRLLYVRGSSGSDSLHVLVSLWGAPSCLLLLADSPSAAPPTVDWDALVHNKSGQVALDGVTEAYGVSLEELIEFDDPDDLANLYHCNASQRHPLSSLQLGSGKLSVQSNSSALLKLSLVSPLLNESHADWEGTVAFTFEILNSNRRTDELPHLQQTGSSLVAGVVLQGVKTDSGYQHPRFGVGLSTFGSGDQKLSLAKSLDDEYTPGVFKLLSLSGSGGGAGGFLQWRPVAYTAAEYTIEHSTTARHYNVTEDDRAPAGALLRGYFAGKADVKHHALPVTFGLTEDGWYTDSKYAAWETTVGLGAPPKDELSLMVILLLGIGLGLPAVALLGGGVWMAVRRLRGGGRRAALLEEE